MRGKYALSNLDESFRFNGNHIQYCCVENDPKDCLVIDSNTEVELANLTKVSSFLLLYHNLIYLEGQIMLTTLLTPPNFQTLPTALR